MNIGCDAEVKCATPMFLKQFSGNSHKFMLKTARTT